MLGAAIINMAPDVDGSGVLANLAGVSFLMALRLWYMASQMR